MTKLWLGLWLGIIGLGIGILVGSNIPLLLPQAYAKYMSVAALAALDSVFGGIRAGMEDNYRNDVFLTGFFSNALLAAGFVVFKKRAI